MSIARYSTTPADNGTRLASGTMSEGMSPSQVNDGVRSLMSSIRSDLYNNAEWIEYGTGSDVCTYTRVSATSLSMPVDVTNIYTVNRRVRIVDGTGATLYGRVTSCTYSSPNSTLVFEFDSGSLGSGNPTSVRHGIISSTNTSAPATIPSGSIQMYGGATAPSGFLMCDGTAISRTTYSELFSAISISFGSGDGSSTFNLPNLQSKFPLGKSGSYALGSTGGAFTQTPSGSISSTFSGNPFTPLGNISVSGTVEGHQLSTSEMPSHNHSMTIAGGGNSGGYIHATYGSSFAQADANVSISSYPYITMPSAVIGNTGGNSTHAHGFSGSGTFNGTSSTPTGSVASTLTGSALDTTNPYVALNYIIKY